VRRPSAEAEGFEIATEFIEVETGKGADALDRRSIGSGARRGPPSAQADAHRRRAARPAVARRALHQRPHDTARPVH
jgi:hypothetical protein